MPINTTLDSPGSASASISDGKTAQVGRLENPAQVLAPDCHDPARSSVARTNALRPLDARARIETICDARSFAELGSSREHRAVGFGMEAKKVPGDGVVVGSGTVQGRLAFFYSQDTTVLGGSLGEAHASKIQKVMDLAEAQGAPVIAITDSGGARIQEGVRALAGYGGIFHRNVRLSGVVPQISVVVGPCAGGASYSPALTDFVFMVRGSSRMYVTGPDVVAAVTGEVVTHEELGGADVHGSRSGVAAFVYDDEIECLEEVRTLLGYLPSNYTELAPRVPSTDPCTRSTDSLAHTVPNDPRTPYDVRDIVSEVLDDGYFIEVHEQWAQNLVCGIGALGERVVGIVANQPSVLAGVLDIDTSDKGARFVRFCDAFNIPLITLVDVPGFLPGADQESRGIIRHGARLLHAYCAATTPRIQLILRKAYGGAYIVMDSEAIGADICLAWPTNEVAVMGASAAIEVIASKAIAQAEDPYAAREARIAEYTERLMNPMHAAREGAVHEVIDPARTRSVLARSLITLENKRQPLVAKKHGIEP